MAYRLCITIVANKSSSVLFYAQREFILEWIRTHDGSECIFSHAPHGFYNGRNCFITGIPATQIRQTSFSFFSYVDATENNCNLLRFIIKVFISSSFFLFSVYTLEIPFYPSCPWSFSVFPNPSWNKITYN